MSRWMKVIGFRPLEQQCEMPKWYGVAYKDYASMNIVIYPIPFNWIVWLFREIHFLLIRVPEGAVDKAYAKGRADADEFWRNLWKK